MIIEWKIIVESSKSIIPRLLVHERNGSPIICVRNVQSRVVRVLNTHRIHPVLFFLNVLAFGNKCVHCKYVWLLDRIKVQYNSSSASEKCVTFYSLFWFYLLVVYWSFYWGHCFSAGQVSEKRPFIPSAVISCATITLWKIFCKLLSLRRERPVSDGRDKLRPGFFLFQLGSHVPRWRTLIHWLSKKYVGKEPGDGVAAGDENQKQSVVDDRGCWWVLKSCATYRTIGACSGAWVFTTFRVMPYRIAFQGRRRCYDVPFLVLSVLLSYARSLKYVVSRVVSITSLRDFVHFVGEKWTDLAFLVKMDLSYGKPLTNEEWFDFCAPH